MLAPLADRLRPVSLDDMVGQPALIGEKGSLRRIISSGNIPNMIFYGPPGVGKTTLAGIIAKQTNRKLHRLNGTSASTADIKSILGEIGGFSAMNGVLLYLDEIQYFTKKQQQTLLESLEDGRITLIASTTENPYFYVYGAILSRSAVFEFVSVQPEEIKKAAERAAAFLEQENGCKLIFEPGAIDHIVYGSGGDVRKAIGAVELCWFAAGEIDGVRHVTEEVAADLTDRRGMRYDKGGDEHYNILSAYQKSMRGSDPDAALHYLARLLEAGDLPSACRRLMVCAAEDVGLAYPMILPIVKAAVDIALQVGLPEARIPLADAVVLVALSPKSNSAYIALDAASADIRNGQLGEIPSYLQDSSYSGAQKLGKGIGYSYPHSAENHWIEQQYLPDILKDKRYYIPGNNKNESLTAAYWEQIKSTYGNKG